MPTTSQLLNHLQHALTNLVERPDLEALDLLAVATGRSTAGLLAAPEDTVTDNIAAAAHDLLRRRSAGEPLAYLIGSQYFHGRSFIVTPDVLIPRPATEIIVDQLLSSTTDQPQFVADIGTGSGAVAITLALARPTWHIVGIDKSAPALAVAKKNSARLQAEVDWRLGFLADPLATTPIDIIVANLPYLPTQDSRIGSLMSEPELALDGGPDGLQVITTLLNKLPHHPRHSLWLECLPGQAAPIRSLIANNWSETSTRPLINDQQTIVGVCSLLVANR